MLNKRYYYSTRNGKNPSGREIDLSFLRRYVASTYSKFEMNGYLTEAVGMNCQDEGFVPGQMGHDVDTFVLFRLKKENIFPYNPHHDYSEDDIFDLIEFLYDHISKPMNTFFHGWNNSCLHYGEFDRDQARVEFRNEINEILLEYNGGWELSQDGELLSIGDSGLSNLYAADLKIENQSSKEKVEAAILKFRRHGSSIDDRRAAVRDLADVLEFMREDLKLVLISNDESDLFNIANNFGIRHHNQKQKTNYDQVIWLSWIFYYYLSTIHAATRLIEKRMAF